MLYFFDMRPKYNIFYITPVGAECFFIVLKPHLNRVTPLPRIFNQLTT